MKRCRQSSLRLRRGLRLDYDQDHGSTPNVIVSIYTDFIANKEKKRCLEYDNEYDSTDLNEHDDSICYIRILALLVCQLDTKIANITLEPVLVKLAYLNSVSLVIASTERSKVRCAGSRKARFKGFLNQLISRYIPPCGPIIGQ